MKFYFRNETDAAGYVAGMLLGSKPDCVLTMTMRPVKSKDFCVHTAIDTSSDVIELPMVLDFLKGRLSI